MSQDFQGESQFKTITPIASAGESTVKTVADAGLTIQTECQANPKSSECKADIMNAAEMMTILFVPVILALLLVARLNKLNSAGYNFLWGIVILIITFVYSLIIGTHNLSEYLTEYPSVLAVMLFGASFGVNLVSPFITEQVVEQPKGVVAEEPAIEIENKSFVKQIEKLSKSLDEAAEASKELIALYKETEKECDDYKKNIEQIKSIAERALVITASEKKG
ncbi:hypothetical protein BBM16_21040 [Vibrio parahaemolyticus]|uniref:hypothetical protein n=3 Tax=Vibrio parahaemolyticus TaxID=670 RepID=UPI00084BB663|nr:hypothetical protein [Vibrio parahaemolyticus]ODY08976.1 hypothetical protein BBM16_21040 [Vibrio parahaemolyticus]